VGADKTTDEPALVLIAHGPGRERGAYIARVQHAANR